MPLFWEAFFTFKPCQAQDIAHNIYLTVTNPVSLALRQLRYLYSISSLILHMQLVMKSCYLFLIFHSLCVTPSHHLLHSWASLLWVFCHQPIPPVNSSFGICTYLPKASLGQSSSFASRSSIDFLSFTTDSLNWCQDFLRLDMTSFPTLLSITPISCIVLVTPKTPPNLPCTHAITMALLTCILIVFLMFFPLSLLIYPNPASRATLPGALAHDLYSDIYHQHPAWLHHNACYELHLFGQVYLIW